MEVSAPELGSNDLAERMGRIGIGGSLTYLTAYRCPSGAPADVSPTA